MSYGGSSKQLFSVLSILVIISLVYLSINGFNNPISAGNYKLGTIGIPKVSLLGYTLFSGASSSISIGFGTLTFMNLVEVFFSAMAGLLFILIVLQAITGLLGGGMGNVSLILQYVMLSGLFLLFSSIDSVPLASIPFGLGSILLVCLSIVFFASLILHQVG